MHVSLSDRIVEGVSVRWAALCVPVLVIATATAVRATPGDLDPSFGTGGKVTTPIGSFTTDFATALALQADGKLVAAGYTIHGGSDYDFAVTRYDIDGTLDGTFGTGGKVTTPIGSGIDDARAVAIQADGKIVAAGYTAGSDPGDFALVRYDTDGTLDGTFGTGGKVTTSIGSGADVVQALVVQTDGKLVAAGRTAIGNDNHLALVRYNSDGSLDGAFGTGGKVTTSIGSSNEAAALVVQTDGKLVAAGKAVNGDGNTDFALVRYNADGTLDGTFGTGGIVVTDFGSFDEANALVLQTDGRLVAAGYTYGGTNSGDFALARYNTDGSLDGNFGTGGKVTTTTACCGDVATGLVVQTDGKLVAGGYTIQLQYDFALARYNTNGSLDGTFGAGGMVTTPVGGGQDLAFALVRQADGKLVAAGTAETFQGNDFALVRYLNDSCGAEGSACDDGNGCTGPDICQAGVCRPGACHVGQVCSGGGCDPAMRCAQSAGCDPTCSCQLP